MIIMYFACISGLLLTPNDNESGLHVTQFRSDQLFRFFFVSFAWFCFEFDSAAAVRVTSSAFLLWPEPTYYSCSKQLENKVDFQLSENIDLPTATIKVRLH
jgi:hypothetical protein